MRAQPPPERRCLPLADWPASDRAAWSAAIATGDVFDGRGPAVHWRPATCKTNMVHYGRWLGFLRWRGSLDEQVAPADRVTPANIEAYVRHLETFVAPRTVVSMLVGLKVMIKAMAREHSWRWLTDLCNLLNRTSKPVTEKRARMRSTQEIYAAAIADMDRLKLLGLKGRNRLCAYRDSLMVALLAGRPLRLKNFTALGLGTHFVRVGEAWEVRIPGAEVKNDQPLEFDLVPGFAPYLDTYLEEVRPTLLMTGGMNRGDSNRLWISWEGTAMPPRSVFGAIKKQTRRLLGVAINPHLFRDCAATSLSTESPAAARSAAPLLGHRFFSTTERYYVRATQLQAGRTIHATLAEIKSDKP